MRFFPIPLETLLIELFYLVIIFSLCAYIYYKTKDAYSLTGHQGLFYFKNIFFYFALAYLTRFCLIMYFTLSANTVIAIGKIHHFSFILVSYLSTMALFSLIMAMLNRHLKTDFKNQNWLFHFLAIALSLTVFLSKTFLFLTLLQLTLLLATSFFILSKSKKTKSKKHSYNKITFFMISIFWICNLLVFSIRRIGLSWKIPLYLISIGLFLSILYRLQKRL